MFTGHENHDISLNDAAELTSRYRTTLMPLLGGIKGMYFSKDALSDVLAQTDCVGVRIYLGLSSDLIPKPKLVIVGVNEDGDDLTDGKILDLGQTCPPHCSSITDLLS